jgi:hypothetical protein
VRSPLSFMYDISGSAIVDVGPVSQRATNQAAKLGKRVCVVVKLSVFVEPR